MKALNVVQPRAKYYLLSRVVLIAEHGGSALGITYENKLEHPRDHCHVETLWPCLATQALSSIPYSQAHNPANNIASNIHLLSHS